MIAYPDKMLKDNTIMEVNSIGNTTNFHPGCQ